MLTIIVPMGQKQTNKLLLATIVTLNPLMLPKTFMTWMMWDWLNPFMALHLIQSSLGSWELPPGWFGFVVIALKIVIPIQGCHVYDTPSQLEVCL
jgi:hypothetical protein